MNIALIAHDAKKDLMVQFCTAYYGILSKHSLCSTGTTGKLIHEATSLKLHRFLSGIHGGVQQVMSAISCLEVDILLYFRDPLGPQDGIHPDDIGILRECDKQLIPLATNITTAEALLHALDRGDLDYLIWRDGGNEQRKGF